MERLRMSMGGHLLGIALVLAVLGLFPLAASADTFRFSGNAAFGEFSSFDTDGNYEQTYVFAGEIGSRAHQPPGPPQKSVPGTVADVYVFRYLVRDPGDPDDDVMMFFHASSASPTFQAGSRLSSASLQGVFEVQYCEVVSAVTYEPFSGLDCPTELTVDLVWTATGALQRSHGNFHYKTDGFMVHSRHQTTSRPASAAGSLTDGTTDYTWGSASTWAEILDTRQGEVIIGDYPWYPDGGR